MQIAKLLVVVGAASLALCTACANKGTVKSKTEPANTGPVAAEASPVKQGDKQERLADLLRLYKANQITPQEYHQQRAKIIGEP